MATPPSRGFPTSTNGASLAPSSWLRSSVVPLQEKTRAAFTNANNQKPFGTRLKSLSVLSSIEKLFFCVRVHVCLCAYMSLFWCCTLCVIDEGQQSFCVSALSYTSIIEPVQSHTLIQTHPEHQSWWSKCVCVCLYSVDKQEVVCDNSRDSGSFSTVITASGWHCLSLITGSFHFAESCFFFFPFSFVVGIFFFFFFSLQ